MVYFASTFPESEAKTARLKAALFLQGSTLYEMSAVRARVDTLRDILLLERAIIDGKVCITHSMFFCV